MKADKLILQSVPWHHIMASVKERETALFFYVTGDLEDGGIMPDWVKIRGEYENTGISQRNIAKKYGVSYNTLSKRANREHWAQRRNESEQKINAKIHQKTEEKVSNAISDEAAAYARARALIAQGILRRLEAMDSMDSKCYEYKVAADTMKICMEMSASAGANA